MKNLKIKTDPKVDIVFNNYPKHIRPKMMQLRKLVWESAKELENIAEIEETLKWGEPSYITKIGSTLRMDWKEKTPNQYALYFKCTSKLVETFKIKFGKKLKFETNRAIVFNLDEKIPEKEVKQCIKAALTYHKIKKLPLLGL